MTNVDRNITRQHQAGLTLVELLVVIAVLGFFSAMAIPTIKDIVSESMDAAAKRNAQNIAMVASVAEVMGSDAFVEVTTIEEAVGVVVAGTDASFGNASFAAGDLSQEEIAEALRFLRFERGVILYSADPSKTGGSGVASTAASSVATPVGKF